MIKKLVRHGNSLALVIERPILALLGADENTVFKITTDGNCLILTPIKDDPNKKKVNNGKRKTN
ncbi:AbrB/MazE/SpoVT family DNA-binding domain-containing protein [Candidatus Dependentiae bacterium]|nr:AbrB/MazE/SpoVT family DNA-binding domain-containing protein [Candidatus Dependentiae bacterium]